jgi:hypothetical protein
LNITFSDSISLVGYDLYCGADGNTLSVTLHWEATSSVSKNYTVFVHLFSSDGGLVTQHDASPVLPTGQWATGMRVIDMHTLALLPGQLLSDSKIWLGLYHWPDMERVPIVQSDCVKAENASVLLGTTYEDGSESSGDLICPGVRWKEGLDNCAPVQNP